MQQYQISPTALRDLIIRQAFGDNSVQSTKKWNLVEDACKSMRAGKWDSVVYFIRLESRIKIGTSTNPKARLSELPWDTVELLIRGDVAEERELHRRFEKYRVQGEWFRAEPELVDYIKSLREKLEQENGLRFPNSPPFPWGIGDRIPGRRDLQLSYLRYHLRDHLPACA